MLDIQDILRAHSVKRWVIVSTTRDQSLAEHTFNVVMIARAIAKKYGIDDDNIIKAALEHDLDEIINGDIPTPTKERLFNSTKQLYSSGHNRDLSEPEYIIIKAADMLDAIWFLSDYGVGRHSANVTDYLLNKWGDFTAKIRNTYPALFSSIEKVVKEYETGPIKI
jgi:hypothetical protein